MNEEEVEQADRRIIRASIFAVAILALIALVSVLIGSKL